MNRDFFRRLKTGYTEIKLKNLSGACFDVKNAQYTTQTHLHRQYFKNQKGAWPS